ncbi:hypothetical protein ACQ4PT_043551 [Festuca glaucescens]
MDTLRRPTSFLTQANALLRKNLCLQKRNWKTNIGITFFPVIICVLLIVLQNVINSELDKPKYRCGCACVETDINGTCKKRECGVQYSTLEQVWNCAIPSLPRWLALIQVPQPEFRAVKTVSQPFDDLPDPSCRDSWSCHASVLVTGRDRSFAESVAGGLFPAFSPTLNVTDYLDTLSRIVVGSDTAPWYTQLLEPAFSSSDTIYLLQPQCVPYLSQTISYNARGIPLQLSYDFLSTTEFGLGINVLYNSTYNDKTAYSFIAALRVPRLVNAVSNAYLKYIRGPGVEMLLEYVKEMPKVGTSYRFDLSSLLSALFFTWIVELLFPVMLAYLVYEKQQKLKIMMKMQGLKDVPYWMISYAYFFVQSVVYMTCFVIFGYFIGLNFFRLNNYGIQFVFFLCLHKFTDCFCLFCGIFLFICQDSHRTFSGGWVLVMEIVLGFSLYRGLYELGQYAFAGSATGSSGMMWGNLKDPVNGMCDILIIMTVEWALLLELAFYLDQMSSRRLVEQLLMDRNANEAVICDNLRKMYPGRDGNPDKLAVRGLSLALPKGQCFGMLGPNGAGKTSFISMIVGLTRPTSGTAYAHGMDITMDMDDIYTNMGVCPQHDLLWETLTGKEHLFFYARLKNLKGAALVKVPLICVTLFECGICISLLENSIQHLSLSHSMEEAEVLCDRLGIFVDGEFQCIGNPKELKERYGGAYIFTVTTSPEQESEVDQLVRHLSPSANKIYNLSGTQKFELSKQEVRIADVFRAVEVVKSRFSIHAWGLVDTTLEYVFIKVAKGAEVFNDVA